MSNYSPDFGRSSSSEQFSPGQTSYRQSPAQSRSSSYNVNSRFPQSSSSTSTRSRDLARQRQFSNYFEQSRNTRQGRVMEQRGIVSQEEQELIDQQRIQEYLNAQSKVEINDEFQEFVHNPTIMARRVVYDHLLDLISDANSLGFNPDRIHEMQLLADTIVDRLRVE